MSYLGIYAVLLVGFALGYCCCGLLTNARRNTLPVAPSATVTAITPQAMARMGEALSHAGDMMNAGDFEYVSGGFIVQDLGHGVVNFKGDLSLRAKEE